MRNDALYVAVVGGANVDIQGRPYKSLIERDSNPGHVQVSPGGVARNVAENLARLGIAVRLISAVGDDEHGRQLLQACLATGVEPDLMQRIGAQPTATYLAIVDERGDMRLAISDTAVLEQLSIEYLESCRDQFNGAALTVIDTNLAEGALEWIVATAADKPLFVDTVSSSKAERIKPYLAGIHTLKASRIEAEKLTGIDTGDHGRLPDVARWFHAHGVERLFVTLGENGVFYSTAESQGISCLDPAGTDVRNSGGAGDAFLAGLVCAWLDDLPLEDSLTFSLAAADVTLAYPGTNNPALSRETIAARLEQALD